MDDKEFRKLRREDLIEIIYQYQRREQRLIQENQLLRSQLEDRRIRLEKSGSIAEAALALSGVFEAAQKAADLYLQSVKAAASDPVKDVKKTLEPLKEEKKPAKADVPQTEPAQKKIAPAAKTVQDNKQEPAGKHEEKAENKPTSPTGKLPELKTGEKPVKQEPSGKASNQPSADAEKKAPEPQNQKAKANKPDAAKTAAAEPEKIPPQPPVQKTASQKQPDAGEKQNLKTAVPDAKQPVGGTLKAGIPQKPAETSRKNVPARKNGSVTPAKKPGASTASGNDTDAFIASLKEYLGM